MMALKDALKFYWTFYSVIRGNIQVSCPKLAVIQLIDDRHTMNISTAFTLLIDDRHTFNIYPLEDEWEEPRKALSQ